MCHKILAVDIGNTRAKFGLFSVTDQRTVTPLEINACVLEATPGPTAALASWWLRHGSDALVCALVAGSNPEARDELLRDWPIRNCEPRTIDRWTQIPIGMDVEFPEKVGIDRLLNAFAAAQITGLGTASILVDSGTATTADLLTSDHVFRGGSILPGLRLSAFAMHDYTARLPLVDVDHDLTSLPEVPGRNTESAMKAGLFIGQLGAVRELSSRLSVAAIERFGEPVAPELFVTGGGGRQLTKHLAGAKFIDSLALHGLAMLALKSL